MARFSHVILTSVILLRNFNFELGKISGVRLFSIFCLLLGFSIDLAASTPGPMWADWNLGVHPQTCLLMRRYHIQHPQETAKRGFMRNSPYYRASIRFHANTQSRGDVIPPNQVGRILFVVQIVRGYTPDIEQWGIQSVNVGQFEVTSKKNDHQYDFFFSEEGSAQIMKRLEKNETLELVFNLTNGEKLESQIFPGGNRNFAVWADLFRYCIVVNTK